MDKRRLCGGEQGDNIVSYFLAISSAVPCTDSLSLERTSRRSGRCRLFGYIVTIN